ncbi:hypothetical protein [Flexivirga oryzae]|uniref:Carbamoyl-phosphate synthase large subunit n=1 Tax=Flexivirga oryzae TaxID=1794944 RepID=A0A839N3B5_9MICO|nr:hypothetical protein [Flexivirga oryzae]MBB2890136.1 carbamoyl-phosphate synthase large subunit [Flexivirga oryzae]
MRDAGAGQRVALLGGGGSPVGRELAEQLIARGIRVHSADARALRVRSVANHVVPDATDPGFLPAIARLVRRHLIDIVIPLNTVALQQVSAGRSLLGTDVDVVVPGAGPAAIMHDRLLVSAKLWSHGVTIPNFAVPSDLPDVDAALRLMAGEFVLRARFVTDRRTATLVRTSGDLDWSTLDDNSLVQQFVAGAAYAVIVHRPPNGGRRLTVVLEKTIRADGEVVTSRVAGDRRVEEVERVAQATVRALGLTGPAEVMLRSSSDGTPIVLDVTAGFGPHSPLVPELVDVVLESHAQHGNLTERLTDGGGGTGGSSLRHARGQR